MLRRAFLVIAITSLFSFAAALPATFDPRTSTSLAACFEILDQGQCGSCFIHSAASSISTRLCMKYAQDGGGILGQLNFDPTRNAFVPSSTFQQVSTQYIIDCMAGGNDAYAPSYTYQPNLAISNGGVCQQGGFPSDALLFLALTTPAANTLATSFYTTASFGTFWPTCTNGCTEGCRPYESGQCSESAPTATSSILTNACPSQTCPLTGALYCVSTNTAPVSQIGMSWTAPTSGKTPLPVFVNSFHDATVAEIQAEIQTNGPVPTAIHYCNNTGLSDYGWNACVVDGAVAPYTESETCTTTFGHSVTLVGWTTLGSQTVWIVQNSWGATWGVDGFFYLPLGSNTFGVEFNVVAPQLTTTNTDPSPAGSDRVSSYMITYGTNANNEGYRAALPASRPLPGASSVGYSKGHATSNSTRTLAMLALTTFASQKQIHLPEIDQHPTVWMQTTAIGVVMRTEGLFVTDDGTNEYHIAWMLRSHGNNTIAIASSQRMTSEQIALHKQGWSVFRPQTSPPTTTKDDIITPTTADTPAWIMPTVALLSVAIVVLAVALFITHKRISRHVGRRADIELERVAVV